MSRDVVDATLPYLSAPVAAMVELMWWTSVRPSELFGLRPCDIDQSHGNVWLVELDEHKTAGHDAERTIKLGPKCIAVLRPFMPRPASRPRFCPCEALAEVHRRRRDERSTPLYRSHVARYEREKAGWPGQAVGDTYRADTFRNTIHRAIDRTNREREATGLLRDGNHASRCGYGVRLVDRTRRKARLD